MDSELQSMAMKGKPDAMINSRNHFGQNECCTSLLVYAFTGGVKNAVHRTACIGDGIMQAKGYGIYNVLPDSKEENILEILQYITDMLVGEEVLNLGIQVKVAFYNDASINATVVKCGETYYISLSIGVL